MVASRAEQQLDRLLALRGGVALSYATRRASATGANTKSLSSDDCVQIDVERTEGDELNLDRCAFLVRASAFASGFSHDNPVTPRAGDLVTKSGETVPWTVRGASERGAGAYYRLDADRDRDGWDS